MTEGTPPAIGATAEGTRPAIAAAAEGTRPAIGAAAESTLPAIDAAAGGTLLAAPESLTAMPARAPDPAGRPEWSSAGPSPEAPVKPHLELPLAPSSLPPHTAAAAAPSSERRTPSTRDAAAPAIEAEATAQPIATASDVDDPDGATLVAPPLFIHEDPTVAPLSTSEARAIPTVSSDEDEGETIDRRQPADNAATLGGRQATDDADTLGGREGTDDADTLGGHQGADDADTLGGRQRADDADTLGGRPTDEDATTIEGRRSSTMATAGLPLAALEEPPLVRTRPISEVMYVGPPAPPASPLVRFATKYRSYLVAGSAGLVVLLLAALGMRVCG
jgi:hypothetical protein